jgi:hypothetical protein
VRLPGTGPRMTDDELTQDDLENERAGLLPDREAMSLITPAEMLPIPDIRLEPPPEGPFDPPPDGDLPPLANDTDPPPDRWE